MPPTALIVYGGRFGQSEKIARSMATTIQNAGVNAELVALSRSTAVDPSRHDGLLLVTSVRYGHFDRNAYRLIERSRDWLEKSPALLATVSLTARSPEKRDPATHSYTVKFRDKSQWPGDTEVLAGELNYPGYRIWDRLAIQLIMKITDGPTDPTTHIEYTDWEQVRAAARRFVQSLKAADQDAR